MNKVSIIIAGALMLSLASFQSGVAKNQQATAMRSASLLLHDMQRTNEGILYESLVVENNRDNTPAYAERFEITQNTSKAELENMKNKAEDDGIKFTYTSKFEGDKLSKLSLDLSLDNKDEGRKQSMKTDLDMDGAFSYTLAWENDSNGKAKHITYGKTEGFDDADSADNFDQSFERMDSLASNMKEEMELEREKMKEEMDKMRKNMKKDVKEFEEEEISENEEDDFSDSSSKNAKKMQTEMKEEMRKMKKEFKKQQKEMEAEMKEMKKQMKKQQKGSRDEEKRVEIGEGARV